MTKPLHLYASVGVSPRPGARLLNLFFRAALISLLQSAGVVLLARHSWWGLATAFCIGYQWAGNSRAIVVGRSRVEQICYGVGVAAGTAVTLWCSA